MMLELVFEIIIINFFANVVGVFARYYFFTLIGKEKTIEYLRGDSKDSDENTNANQILYNAFIGIGLFFIFSFGLACLMWLLDIL